MDLKTYIQLILLCVVNVFFTFCGIFLNSLVILSFIKSSQLRKKLCHFMIMILSCVDLLAVTTNHPMVVIFSIAWLNEKYDSLSMLTHALRIGNIFLTFSLLTLFVMSIDRYLAMAYPLFHRVSVTKRRLLTLLAFLFLFDIILIVLAFVDWIITIDVAKPLYSICRHLSSILASPTTNCWWLSEVSEESAGTRRKRRKALTIVKLKNISTSLLAVACFVLFSIPVFIFIAIRLVEKPTSTNARLSWLWATTA